MFNGNQRQLDRMERLLRRIYVLARLIFLRRRKPPRTMRFGLHITKGKEPAMTKLDPRALLNNQKEDVFVVLPNDDGTEDTTTDVSFASSDPSVGIEEHDDGRSATITTPADSGSATITISAPGYEDVSVDVTYSPPVPKKINVSFGAPVSDL